VNFHVYPFPEISLEELPLKLNHREMIINGKLGEQALIQYQDRKKTPGGEAGG
jgi:hypothetical protein